MMEERERVMFSVMLYLVSGRNPTSVVLITSQVKLMVASVILPDR